MTKLVDDDINALFGLFLRFEFHKRIVLQLLTAARFFDRIGNVKKVKADFVTGGQFGRIETSKI